ncbi:MAG: peptidoglycan-binding domain-containing protein [Dermatophilaceae bacterium]
MSAQGRGRWSGAVVVAVVVAGGAGWWAGHQVSTPTVAEATPRTDGFVVAAVAQASVGRSLPLSVTVAQPVRPVARNALAGVVTAVNPGSRAVGDVVYSVANVPVRVVAGTLPFYRDLAVEARGPDVAQLERALVGMGRLGTADSYYGTATVAAVKAWQKSLGIEQTGTVPLGQVVAVPSLPTQVSLGEPIVVGGVVAGGEESVLAPTGARTFELEVSEQQAKLIPEGSTVNVSLDTVTWPAVISGSRVDANSGSTVFALTASGGGPVCGADCARLPAQPKVALRSEVVVVPKVSGPAAPAAAVRTRADGTAYVIDETGAERTVTVKASSGGLVVVDGVQVGTRVRVPADPAGNG